MPDDKPPIRPNVEGLETHPLVNSLIPDPAQHNAGFTVVSGYLGKGTDDDTARLYTSPSLDEFIEIKKSDIAANKPSDTDGGPTTLWLHPGTTVRHTRITSRQVQAEMLGGDLTSQGATGSPSGGAILFGGLQPGQFIAFAGTPHCGGSPNCNPPIRSATGFE